MFPGGPAVGQDGLPGRLPGRRCIFGMAEPLNDRGSHQSISIRYIVCFPHPVTH